MNRNTLLPLAVALAAALTACPNTDTPEARATITGNLEGWTLGPAKVKASIFTPTSSNEVIAEGDVTQSGAFNVRLPSGGAIETTLIPTGTACPEGSTGSFTAEPSDAHIALGTPEFQVFTANSDQPVATLVLTSYDPSKRSQPDVGGVEVYMNYVDRDLTLKGTCTSDTRGKMTVDAHLKAGWNATINKRVSANETLSTTGPLPEGVKWRAIMKNTVTRRPVNALVTVLSSSVR